MKSPLKFLSDKKWATLCDKYHVSPKFKPKKLGEGVSAKAYTFGKKLIIKHTDCIATVDVARKLRRKNIDIVAKVFEVGKTSRPYSEWTDYYGHDSYYIIQEFVKKKKSAKVNHFCNNFENIAHAMADISNAKVLRSFVDIAFKLKRCGINLSEISDLHDQNVFATGRNGLKIVDLGCLDFGNC